MASWPKNILLISFNPRFLAGKTHHISQPMIMWKKVSIRNWATHWACFVVWGMWKEAEREGLKTDRTCFDHLVGICLMFIFSFPELCVWCYNWLLCPEPLRDTCGPGRVYRPTDTAIYCRILLDTAGYCQILPDNARYCQILSDTLRYPQIPSDTVVYCLMRSYIVRYS